MVWFGPRLFACFLWTMLGALAGYGIGLHLPAAGPFWPVAIGAVAGAFVASSIDIWRGARLMRWLRAPGEGAAPLLKGQWGEAGDRMERALRDSARRLAEEQQRMSRLLQAIEASPIGVMLIDAGEQIVWCSRVAADHMGLDPTRDLRQRITNLVRAPNFVAYLQAREFSQPVIIPGKQGKVMLSVTVRAYGAGERLLLTQDVTERERADSMRRDFVANVSHEIRTPLTVLSGFVETLASVELAADDRKRVLELMSQQARRMQTLVGDLLTLARLEGSPRPPVDVWVPLAGRIGDQVESAAVALSGGRHELDLHWPAEVAVAGSESELASAIGNLLNNAVRYTPDGGHISLVWRERADGAGELDVTDTGPGIAREHLARLSERFYRVDSSRSRDTGGTGLGLSIVKHVIQRHGGELVIESELGVGSTFRLVFPSARIRVGQGDGATAASYVMGR